MKTLRLLQFGCLASVLFATTTFAASDVDDLTKVKVVRIKGSARFTTGTGAWQPLKVGDILDSGTVIQTAEGSRVDMVLGDPEAVPNPPRVGVPMGSAGPSGGPGGDGTKAPPIDQNFIRVQENTVLSLDKLTATDTGAGVVTDTQLDLRAGKIFGTVKKLTPGSLYEVKIPNGVAGIRGTIYVISADGVVSVLQGGVVVAYVNADGQVIRRDVPGGREYDPRTDTMSDLSPTRRREIVESIMETYVRPVMTSTTFSFDGTSIYISPTAGYSANPASP